MLRKALIEQIKRKQSFLCIGLDPDPDRIPSHLGTGAEAALSFMQSIIDSTHDLAVAYKPNLAFFEAYGEAGWKLLQATIDKIPNDCFVIADAKRGDIGNTAKKYAQAFFTELGADAVTLSPYMGRDSIDPFLGMSGKWAIMLAITSNDGADDIQMLTCESGMRVFEETITKAIGWAGPDELMFVVGATRPELVARARELAPDYFFLVPGVGAQGGDLQSVVSAGMNTDVGILVNSSRGILYAGENEDFQQKTRQAATTLQLEMAKLLQGKGILI